MPKFLMGETIHSYPVKTARLGTTSAKMTANDTGKPVKLSGESQYDLCAANDFIEGFISSVETDPTYDGYTLGGVLDQGYKAVQFEGTTADQTASVAVGDYVVMGTVVAKGTAQGSALPKVRKHATQATALAAAFKWRVVSLGTAATGAAGTNGLIERV